MYFLNVCGALSKTNHLFISPTVRFLFKSAKVDHPVDHRCSHFFNGLGLRLKRRSSRTNDGTAFSYRFHVIDVNETQWSVARNKNKFSSFFEHYVGGTGD